VFYAARSQRRVAAVIFGCTFPATEDRASAEGCIERSQGGRKGKEVVATWHRVAALTEYPTKKVEARDMAAYIIGLGRSAPRGMAWAREYLPKTAALVAKHGGKALIRGNSTPRLLALEGKPPLAVVILEFPSLELAQAWHDDPDYAPLKQLRQANVDMEVFVVQRV
jgi:uncharacterized protein (DUF1330 family)